MFRMPVLFLAFVISGQALWQAFVTHQLAVGAALGRLLIALPVAALALAFLRMVGTSSSTQRTSRRKPPHDD